MSRGVGANPLGQRAVREADEMRVRDLAGTRAQDAVMAEEVLTTIIVTSGD